MVKRRIARVKKPSCHEFCVSRDKIEPIISSWCPVYKAMIKQAREMGFPVPGLELGEKASRIEVSYSSLESRKEGLLVYQLDIYHEEKKDGTGCAHTLFLGSGDENLHIGMMYDAMKRGKYMAEKKRSNLNTAFNFFLCESMIVCCLE